MLFLRLYALELSLNSFTFWIVFHELLLSADFFSKCNIFQKKYFKNTFRVSNSLNPDQNNVLLFLNWVQTVFKSYQQATNGRRQMLLLARKKLSIHSIVHFRNVV